MSDVVMVTIGLDRGIYAGIVERSRKMNRDPKTYIRQLVDGAYAARVGRERNLPVGDLEMDDAVRAVFCLAGEFDVRRISRATGFSEEFCDNVLRGWKKALGEPAATEPAKEEKAAAPATARSARQRPEKPTGRKAAASADYPVQMIRELWAQGVKSREIAERIGKSQGAFEIWCTKHRDVCPKRIRA